MATEYLFSNNATTTLAQSVSATATVLNVASGTGSLFPSPASGQAFAVTLVDAATGLTNEICYCTSRSGDQLTVTRGREGTNATAWQAGDTCANYITADVMESWLQESDLAGYLPLPGGTLTGDTTIKGITPWSTTGNYSSYGLILSGQNGNIVTLRQNEVTNSYVNLAIQVNGYNGSNGYFSLRNDGTIWSGSTQFADRTWANATFQPKGNYQTAGDYALNSRVTAYFVGSSGNATITNLQGVNWASGNTSSYVQVAANGVVLAVPTTDNVYSQITSYAQPKGNYQAAGNYVAYDTYNSDFNTTSDNVINLPYQNREQVFTTTASAGDIVTFPVAFSSVQGCICHTQGNSDFNVKAFNVTNTGFTLHINGGGNNAPIVVYAKGKK